MALKLLVYVFCIPPCLLITFRTWRSGDAFLTTVLALTFLPFIIIALLTCHGRREQALPEAGQEYRPTAPEPDMAPYLATMLEPHERILYSARIQRDAVNEMIKKTGVALLLTGPLGTICWNEYLDLNILEGTVLQLGVFMWLVVFSALFFLFCWSNPANEKPGCVVTNRRIIFKNRCFSGLSGGKDVREFDMLSCIPLKNVGQVTVGKNRLYRQHDLGVVRVLCSDPSAIRRVACADFPLRPEDRREMERYPKPLHYVQHPDMLRQHIESAARRHRL